MKNPACAAVKREAEEDWGMVRRGRRKISVFSVFLNFGPVLEETGRGPSFGPARPWRDWPEADSGLGGAAAT
jgi:hypothetical protein